MTDFERYVLPAYLHEERTGETLTREDIDQRDILLEADVALLRRVVQHQEFVMERG